jgi:hypothetical protein
MSLSGDERKKLLGHGGLARIARRTKRTQGHVTEVNLRGRPDDRVRAEIVREIIRRHPHIAPADVWPAEVSEKAS